MGGIAVSPNRASRGAGDATGQDRVSRCGRTVSARPVRRVGRNRIGEGANRANEISIVRPEYQVKAGHRHWRGYVDLRFRIGQTIPCREQPASIPRVDRIRSYVEEHHALRGREFVPSACAFLGELEPDGATGNGFELRHRSVTLPSTV